MRVPLTPSAAVIDQMARFGPRAQDELLEEVGRQDDVGGSGGRKEKEKSWKDKFRSWMIYQGASPAFSTAPQVTESIAIKRTGPQWVWVGVWFVIQSLVFGFGVVNVR